MAEELPELKTARLKIKAMRAFVRDLDIALARAEDALERKARQSIPQPKEAQGDHQHHRARVAA